MGERKSEMFGRATRYVVMPVEVVRANNIRTNEEVCEAQKIVDDDMIRALEDMLNTAKANQLSDRDAILALGAAAW